MRQHFLYPIVANGREHWLVWFTNDVDGVLLDDQGKIANFLTNESASAYARERFIEVLQSDPRPLDLTWIAEDSSTTLDCVQALEAWNFLADVAASLAGDERLGFIALDQKPSATYDKVFWGNNLPAVTPPGERYNPEWSAEELAEIRLILMTGLRLFLGSLAQAAP